MYLHLRIDFTSSVKSTIPIVLFLSKNNFSFVTCTFVELQLQSLIVCVCVCLRLQDVDDVAPRHMAEATKWKHETHQKLLFR